MTKLIDFSINTFLENLLNVRWSEFQCERGKNSPFNSGDDDIKVLICWRSQSFWISRAPLA